MVAVIVVSVAVIIVPVALVFAPGVATQVNVSTENVTDNGRGIAKRDFAISIHIAHVQGTIFGVGDGRQNVQDVGDHGVIADTSRLAAVAVVGENRSSRGKCQ
jgi:hypothetical protein